MQLYRADHVGRLTRPSELKHAREAFPTGQLSGEPLREVEDRAILDATVYPTRHDLLRDLVPIYQDGARHRWLCLAR